jgi:hypothetical protein
MSHTPGPWTTIERDGDAGISVIGANSYDVAMVKRLIGVNADQYTANAKLIASAPDLLEVCRETARGIEGQLNTLPNWEREILAKYATQLRAAIANAT